MKRQVGFAIIACTILAGCQSVENYDRIQATSFAPNPDGSYTFKAFADAVYPLNSTDAEAKRMRMLGTWTSDNNICIRGFTITNRVPVARTRGIFADVYSVFYTLRCN